MSDNLPYFKFYPGDWLKDLDLRRCSLPAKGVLIEALCIMFQSKERGVLISGGRPWSAKELAESVGGNTDVAARAITELLEQGVLKKRSDGAIYSARMVKDEEVRKKRAAGGKLGGNPQLKVNHTTNVTGNLALIHVPESESEHELESSSEEERGSGGGDWIGSLSSDPAYDFIDVRREAAKAARWCGENRRHFTKRFFVNWLNRIQPPLKIVPINHDKF